MSARFVRSALSATAVLCAALACDRGSVRGPRV
jgi:hypothetical protein